ncbi:MAG: hypothetical protein ACYDH5_18840 [Acidimicrobiales bacterium]
MVKEKLLRFACGNTHPDREDRGHARVGRHAFSPEKGTASFSPSQATPLQHHGLTQAMLGEGRLGHRRPGRDRHRQSNEG